MPPRSSLPPGRANDLENQEKFLRDWAGKTLPARDVAAAPARSETRSRHQPPRSATGRRGRAASPGSAPTHKRTRSALRRCDVGCHRAKQHLGTEASRVSDHEIETARGIVQRARALHCTMPRGAPAMRRIARSTRARKKASSGLSISHLVADPAKCPQTNVGVSACNSSVPNLLEIDSGKCCSGKLRRSA